MNIMSNMDQIADLIIRPSRYLYKPIDLGPKNFYMQSSQKKIYHHDYQFKNSRHQNLKGSLYTTQENVKDIKHIIVYLHCNSGCRIQGLAYMNMILQSKFAYFVFDFGGSGVSDGKYISLGLHQSDDIKTVIKFIKKKIGMDIKIGLWGRSMGAVAALIYLTKQKPKNNIKGAIFDSPFYSLKDLFIAIGRQKTNFPTLVLQVAIKYLKPLILQKARFDMDDVNLSNIGQIKDCPGIFLASKNDQLIPFSQMDMIFKQYGAQKQMLFVEQSHNQPRNKNVIMDAFKTLKKNFQENSEPQQLYTQTKKQASPKQQQNYRSHLPSKEVSRKKLQLTIKSYSQKTLTVQKRDYLKDSPKKINKEISFPYLEKPERRQISCLFQKKKNKRIKFKNNDEKHRVCNNSKDSLEQFSGDQIYLNHSLNVKQHLNKPKRSSNGFIKFFKEDQNSGGQFEKSMNENNVQQKQKFDSQKLESNISERYVIPRIVETQVRDCNVSLKTLKQNINIKNQIQITKKYNKIAEQKKQIRKIRLPQGGLHSRQNSKTNFQRKTMQHITNKKPPLCDSNRLLKLRNSFETKYRSQNINK